MTEGFCVSQWPLQCLISCCNCLCRTLQSIAKSAASISYSRLNVWRECGHCGSKSCATGAAGDAFPAKVFCQSLLSSQDAQASATSLWWTIRILKCPCTVIRGVPLGCIIVFIRVRAASNTPGESIGSTRPPSVMCFQWGDSLCEPRCDKLGDGTSSQNIRSCDIIKFILNLTNLNGVINDPVVHGCISRCCFSSCDFTFWRSLPLKALSMLIQQRLQHTTWHVEKQKLY